ncbi:MAG: pilus assembly protein [Acidobacteria bacterium]|nr:pilus assembly protein [Acidobacteriota bacterium]MDA1234741.1 pilus assembly protein [Acidobacteriota bacterium]
MVLSKSLRRDRRGNAIVELAIGLPVLIMLMFGVVTGGLIFDRYMTVVQLARTGASVFSRGADFSVTANKNLLLLGSEALGMTATGGNGVMYLTRIQLSPPGGSNAGQLVIAERHVIGDPAFHASYVGTPNSQIWPDPDEPLPNGLVDDRNNQSTAIATVPATLNTLPLGESMFVVEVYHRSSELRFGNVWGNSALMASKVYF